jgi:hypothetical protein
MDTAAVDARVPLQTPRNLNSLSEHFNDPTVCGSTRVGFLELRKRNSLPTRRPPRLRWRDLAVPPYDSRKHVVSGIQLLRLTAGRAPKDNPWQQELHKGFEFVQRTFGVLEVGGRHARPRRGPGRGPATPGPCRRLWPDQGHWRGPARPEMGPHQQQLE